MSSRAEQPEFISTETFEEIVMRNFIQSFMLAAVGLLQLAIAASVILGR